MKNANLTPTTDVITLVPADPILEKILSKLEDIEEILNELREISDDTRDRIYDLESGGGYR